MATRSARSPLDGPTVDAQGWAEAAFDPAPESAWQARLFVQSSCQSRGIPTELVETATFLVDELATNVILHARTPYVVRVVCTEPMLEVQVLDGTTELPRRLPPSTERIGGRGIYLLDELSDSWGFTRTPLGKTIWFQLMLIPAPARPA